MKNKLVTISIPTYNSAKTLGKTLESVKSQTYKNIEISVVDSYSSDRTIEISKEYGAEVYQTEWKLLGARKIGVEKAKGDFVLLLDSDQSLKPEAIESAVEMIEEKNLDMLFFGERSYNPQTWLEKLFDLDRIYVHQTYQADPIKGVLLPRFYRRDLLLQAFEPIPKKELEVCIAQDHAIIFYEASKLSSKVDLLPEIVFHMEPRRFWLLVKKNYRYGKSMSELNKFKEEYQDMLNKKTRFRRFHGSNVKGFMASTVILLIKGIPYKLGSIRKS